MCGQGSVLILKMVSYLLSGQGPASSLNSPAINILEFQSTGDDSPITLPQQGRGASTSCLSQVTTLFKLKILPSGHNQAPIK